jgi:multicomponent K+:H+ antiporter subunit E
MKRLLPAPLLSLVLFIVWPVMNLSWSAGHLVLAAVFAITIPWLTERLRPDRPLLRKPGVVVRLGLTVLKDIVVSNIDVARRILGPEKNIKPGFVWIPLSIKDPHGIVAFAGIITMTPGTLSADLNEERTHLLVHCFNMDDPQAVIDSCKSRYEVPLMEIFG